MADLNGEKTQEATPHRRQQAREKGQVAFSQDLGSAAMLVVAVGALMFLGGQVMAAMASIFRSHLGESWLVVDRNTLLVHGQGLLGLIAPTMLPIFAILFVAAILVSVLQVGFLFVPERLQPDFKKLSIVRGLQRIFSVAGLMRLAFGMFKVAIVVGVCALVLWQRSDELLRSASLDIAEIATLLSDVSLQTALWVGLALLILAIFDYAYQRYKHESDLMMTHQEVRDEMKNLQGDPQIVARRRAVQRQMVMHRIADAVPKADVVVTNPTELAVAIRYEPSEMAAPIVVAKGAGVLAARIRKLAIEHNIPIVERKPLAQLLYREVEINHPVPGEAYAAVAEVLAYVYQLQGRPMPAGLG